MSEAWWSERVYIDGELIPACVRFSGGTIDSVQAGARPDDARDFGDWLITPAFVDAHTHLALVALRGYDASAARGNVVEDLFYRFETLLDASDIAAFARVGAFEALASGIGVVWDHYFHASALADAIASTGLCAVVAPTLQDLAGPGVGQVESALAATEALTTRGDGIYAAYGAHATDTVSARLFREVIARAKETQQPIHAHLAQSVEEVERARVRHGCTPAEWLDELGAFEAPGVYAHGLYLSGDDLRRMGDQQTLVSCPMAQTVFAFPAPTQPWDAAGVRWCVATDAVASNDSHNLLKELRSLSRRHAFEVAGSDAHARFIQGTLSAAELWRVRTEAYDGALQASDLLSRVWHIPGALHPAFRAGVLEAGALANMLVWNTDDASFWPGHAPLHTLVHGDALGALHAMVVRGNSIGEEGELQQSLRRSPAYTAAREEADARLQQRLSEL
ncbi:MAG: amidohydrolase family protein [Myxococcota bacterium]